MQIIYFLNLLHHHYFVHKVSLLAGKLLELRRFSSRIESSPSSQGTSCEGQGRVSYGFGRKIYYTPSICFLPSLSLLRRTLRTSLVADS
jgi:hypothetical protein